MEGDDTACLYRGAPPSARAASCDGGTIPCLECRKRLYRRPPSRQVQVLAYNNYAMAYDRATTHYLRGMKVIPITTSMRATAKQKIRAAAATQKKKWQAIRKEEKRSSARAAKRASESYVPPLAAELSESYSSEAEEIDDKV